MTTQLTEPETPTRRGLGLTLGLLAFAQLIISIDYNIVYVALPSIGAELGFGAYDLQWVVSAYAVAFGGLLLLGGRAADLLGKRRVFVLGLGLYAVFSLLGGLASEQWVLIASRAGQGIGGAFLFPATLSLVNTKFAEGKERNKALSIWAAAGASGMLVGSFLGGVLTQAFGWEAVFFVNVPLAGGAILLALRVIDADPPGSASGRFDVLGALTGTAGITLLILTLVQGPEVGWTDPAVLVSAALGVGLLALFVLNESRAREPLMPPRLLRNRGLSTGVSVTLLFMATFGTLLYFVTAYLQDSLGFTALQTGTAFLIPMAGGFAGSLAGGNLANRFGLRRTMVTSLAVGAFGTAGLGWAMFAGGSYPWLLPGFIVLSLCQGVIFTTMFAAGASGVPAEQQGIAAGVVSTGQQIGAPLGLAVLVSVANAGSLSSAVFAAAVGIALAVLVALNLRTPAHHQ